MPLLQSLSAQALRTISQLNRQELSITAWAFATLGLRPRPLLAAISAQSIPTLTDFGPLEISNLAWAFSQLAERHPTLIASIASAAISRGAGTSEPTPAQEGPAANGVYSLAWSSWRALGADIAGRLLQREPRTALREPLVSGVLLMDSEWVRDDLREKLISALVQRGEFPAGGSALLVKSC
mmetsp:Transcript_69169/g.191410  ORF Transcript_69169/g.191410 Transcript_69169/m.191410 type:complete len:182 (-) Transcript_69169:121-666(-)